MDFPAPVAPPPEADVQQEVAQRIREARREYKRAWQRAKRRGEPWVKGEHRQPTSGAMSPMLKGISRRPATLETQGRWRSRRERANELRERMARFTAVYNAAWLVRDAYFGPDDRLSRHVEALWRTIAEEMRKTGDYTALLFATVDALYCSPHGVPWEP